MQQPLDPDRHRLPPAQHREIFERFIRPHVFGGLPAAATPAAIVFGGQPGAGKSTAMGAALRELGGPTAAAAIIGDDFRAYHPDYARLLQVDDKTAAFYTDRDTGAWVELAIDAARALRISLVIEGTMRSAEKVGTTLGLLRESGYRTEARVLAVPHAQSWQAVQLRYEMQRLDRGAGRMTTPDAHAAAFEGLPVTLGRIERERLADRVSVYRRDGTCLYWHDLARDIRSGPTSAIAVLEQQRTAPLSLSEKRLFAADYARLEALVTMPSRRAGQTEIQSAKASRAAADRAMWTEAFLQMPQDQAMKEFPVLQGAYEALRAVAGAITAPPDSEAAKQALHTARAEIARHIELGSLPTRGAHVDAARSAPAQAPGRGR